MSMSPQFCSFGLSKHLRTGSVHALHHILTTRMKPRGFIKSSMQNNTVHMELSLHLSFYLRHSQGGYTVGTTAGFPVETVKALAPRSHRRIPWKCPQYHMSTYSAHHRVDGSGHPLDGGLRGYCQGLVPQVPQATGYNPKFWIQSVPSSSKQLGNHTPRTEYGPTTQV
jgi:hypothetical protein